MNTERERQPLLDGRSFLLIPDFCLNTGLDRDNVEKLIRDGRLEGSLWTEDAPTRPVAIFNDELPSRKALLEMGFSVREDYDPDHIRAYNPIGDDGPFSA